MKKFVKVIARMAVFLILLFFIVWIQAVDPTQKDDGSITQIFTKKLNPESLSMDSLLNIVGSNKGLPSGFEKAALVAYSAYPELQNVKIDMELTQSGAPMESNFSLWTLFGSKSKRQYRILLNNAQNTRFDPILLRELPFDAQVGILAHELGHVAYYHRHSTLQIGNGDLNI